MNEGGTRRPRAAVVLTGSELVTGVIVDANGPWLARELTVLGFEVVHLLGVGDRPDDLAAALQEHCRQKLAPYKYPRWIEFRAELPKTATGKIQRFKLRAESVR